MQLFLLMLLASVEINSGVPGIVDYRIPDGFQTGSLPGDSTYAVIDGRGGVFTIVPLVLSDTLDLPPVQGWKENGDTLLFQPPVVIVAPNFPDTLMSPSFPVYPCFMDIPPGLPEDYARNLSFWLLWQRAPGFPWLPVSAGVLLAAIAAYVIHRRRKGQIPAPTGEQLHRLPAGKKAEEEALALLNSEAFIHRRWPELFTEIERQYRATIALRFAILNPALTLNQIARQLAGTTEGRRFLEEGTPIQREIILQLYADWGSSPDRAADHIRKLARLRREWTR